MIKVTYAEFDALTRVDFNVFVERVFNELNGATSYVDNFHVGVLCAKLEAFRLGQIRRLILNVPPRSLKSIVATVAFPAFVLGHDPASKIIAASYGQDLSDTLARDCRQVMQSAWYRRVFPRAGLATDRRAISDFGTKLGGGRLATSTTGAITGLGADFIVVDDPTKPSDALSQVEREKANQWFNHTLRSRLNNKVEGGIVVVMQRLHEDDFVGHIQGLEDWEVVAFPAIAQVDEQHLVETPHGSYVHARAAGEALHPEFEPLDSLETTRRVMGSSNFAAQYLQMPMPPGGGMIKEEWFVRYEPHEAPVFDQIFQSWDTASKVADLRDYSVCTTWGLKGQQTWLLNVFRKQLEYPALRRAVIDQAKFFNAKIVLIEDRSSGIQLIPDLKELKLRGVTACSPVGDKVMRMYGHTAMLEAEMVHIPAQAHWLEAYLNEMMVFPKGKYDDQVDSTSQALDYAKTGDEVRRWIAFMANQLGGPGRKPEEIPNISIRHPDTSRSIATITGRNPLREQDGSFLLTSEEWLPSLVGAGWYLSE